MINLATAGLFLLRNKENDMRCIAFGAYADNGEFHVWDPDVMGWRMTRLYHVDRNLGKMLDMPDLATILHE